MEIRESVQPDPREEKGSAWWSASEDGKSFVYIFTLTISNSTLTSLRLTRLHSPPLLFHLSASRRPLLA